MQVVSNHDRLRPSLTLPRLHHPYLSFLFLLSTSQTEERFVNQRNSQRGCRYEDEYHPLQAKFFLIGIQGQTLTPGGSIIVPSTQISLAVGGTFAAIGISIQLLTPAESTTKASVLTSEVTTYTADASSAFAIDGQALTTGGVIKVDGTSLSLDIEGTAAIIGSSTQMLSTATIIDSNAASIHLGAQTYTENTAREFIISGQTFAKGGEITVSGTPVSFEASGTGIVIGSSTEAVGAGGWIMSDLAPGAAPTGVMRFEGKALKCRMNLKRVLGVMIAVKLCMLMN